MRKDSLVLRGKLVNFEAELFGIFLIVIQKESSEESTFFVNAALGPSQFISIFDITNPSLEEFTQEISNLLIRGESIISESRKLEQLLIKNKNLIIKLLEKEDMENTLHMALSSRLNLFFENKFQLFLESHIAHEPYVYQDILSNIALKFSHDEASIYRKQFVLPNAVDIIKLDPILSVNGKYVMSLHKGDLVYCMPQKQMMENKILLNEYSLLDDKGNLKKLIGTIESIKTRQEAVTFIVHISSDLYGILDTRANVLIEVPLSNDNETDKLPLPESDIIESDEDKASLKEKVSSAVHNPMYSIIVVILLIILLIIVILKGI